MSNILFILGTGRCGTRSLAGLLASVPGVCSLHEGKGTFHGHRYDLGSMNGLNIFLDRTAYSSSASGERALDIEWLMNANFRSRQKLIGKLARAGNHFAEANRHAYTGIGFLHRLYPDARFLHLVRNGYDCVKSWHSRPHAYPEPEGLLPPAAGREWLRYEAARLAIGLERFLPRPARRLTGRLRQRVGIQGGVLLRRLSAGARLPGAARYMLSSPGFRLYRFDKPRPGPDDPDRESWEGWNRLQKLVWFWSSTNRLIAEQLSRLPARQSRLLKIEDLSAASFGSLLEWSGLPPAFDRDRLRPAFSRQSSPTFWTASLLRQFNETGAAAMNRFGYPLRQPDEADGA